MSSDGCDDGKEYKKFQKPPKKLGQIRTARLDIS
tara:strand:- start:3 stop:104 length:102 start_codon:yes stop_codon:yes gene_type:complete